MVSIVVFRGEPEKNIYFEIRVRLTPSTLGLKIRHFCPILPENGHWEKKPCLIHMMFFELLLYVLALLSPRKGPRSPRDHPDIYQTPTDTLQTPRNSPPFLVKNGPLGHWENMQYIEIKIPTQLFFSIVLALINSRHRPEGPGHPTEGVGGAHGGRQGHQDGRQDGHQEHL